MFVRVLFPDMQYYFQFLTLKRALAPQKRGQRPLNRAEGPKEPSARARMLVQKGDYILVMNKAHRQCLLLLII